jgi:hypothetical protein
MEGGSMNNIPGVIGAMIPIAGIIWLGFVIWTGDKRKEREAFYRNELLKKIVDSPAGSTQSVLDMMHQQEREAQIRKREGLKLAGIILIAAGIGLGTFLALIEKEDPVWAVGLLFLLVGIALFSYVTFMAPRVE